MATIFKYLVYKSNDGHTRRSNITVASIASNQPIAPHTTLVWKPETFEVPYVEITLDNCAVITITYYLQVSGAVDFGLDPTVEIPLVLGNIPLAT